MARYIKANPKVAQELRLENDRNQAKDGNYLLWQSDILPLGRLTDLPLILGQIGAIALAAHEAREEQDGTVIRELPVAEDPRFVVETDNEDPTEEAAQDPAGAEQEQPTGTEEPAEPAEDEAAAEAAESETPNTETV